MQDHTTLTYQTVLAAQAEAALEKLRVMQEKAREGSRKQRARRTPEATKVFNDKQRELQRRAKSALRYIEADPQRLEAYELYAAGEKK